VVKCPGCSCECREHSPSGKRAGRELEQEEAAQLVAQAGLFWFIRLMCLAIPGKILSADDRNGLRVGRVQFGGIVRLARLDFVPEARPGDYVMVHVGFAISRVDEKEAERTYSLLREMGALEAELPPEDNECT
jgi:hydrogenase expression/formation protein HypC